MTEEELLLEKRSIETRLSKIQEHLNDHVRQKILEENYQKFLSRDKDSIIGHAHYDFYPDKDRDTIANRTAPFSVYVEGNAGKSYAGRMRICHTTHIFFHNVWTDNQRYQFQLKLNDLVQKEIDKILDSPQVKLELMGLADIKPYSKFPKDKVELVKENIRKAQFDILDKIDINELVKVSKEYDVFHGKYILKDYLEHIRS